MHPVCNKATKVILQRNVAKQFTFCPEYKALCLGQIQYNTFLSTTLHIFKHGWWLHHVMGMLVIIKDWGVFQDKKKET